MFSILKQFSSGTRKFSLLVLAYAFCLPLHAQEGAMAKADSLLAAGDSLGAFLWVDSIADNQTYRDQAKAMIYAKYAFTISKQLPDPKHQVNALLGIAQIHFVISDYLPALENALRAKSLALEHNLEEDLGNVYNSIGNVYFMQDDVEKALENWEKSLEYRRKFNTPGAVAGSLNNIAKALIGQGEFDKAELYLKEARKLNQEIDHWRWEIFNLMNFHELEVERMNFKAAEAYAKEGLALSEEKDYLDGAHFFKLYLAELAERKGDEDAALGQYMEVLEDGLTPGNREGYVQTLENAAELARKKGSFQEASELQAEYIRLTDSLHKEDLKGEIANLEVANELLAQSREEEFERQELESAQKNELKRAQLMSFIYLLSIGVLLVGAGGLFWGYRQKQRSNKQLAKLVQERTQHLQASNEQLNTFIYKSSHDLYGPVKSLQGLVHLLQKSPADNANTANLIGQKVTQLEAELRHLIQTMELKNSALNPSHLSLHTAVHEAVEAVKSTPGGAKVTFSNTIPENAFLTTDPWTLSVILRNLLENAIHFQSSERTSTCDIKVSQAPSAWCIQVTDNGIGVPAAARDKVFDMFFKGSRQSPGSGLGLYNVQLAVEKLDGTVSLEESDEQGASFKVTLPRKG